jgi:hypothetical protein
MLSPAFSLFAAFHLRLIATFYVLRLAFNTPPRFSGLYSHLSGVLNLSPLGLSDKPFDSVPMFMRENETVADDLFFAISRFVLQTSWDTSS